MTLDNLTGPGAPGPINTYNWVWQRGFGPVPIPLSPGSRVVNPHHGASWTAGGGHVSRDLWVFSTLVKKPVSCTHTSHLKPCSTYYDFFNQLRTVQELMLFSFSPRPPPRGHSGNLWYVVLQKGRGGQRTHTSSRAQGTEVVIPPVCETPATKIL